jgi:predicted RNA-binding protein with PUA-like domain
MPRRYWLMKCEPSACTIDDLARDGRTSWEGVDAGYPDRFAWTKGLGS